MLEKQKILEDDKFWRTVISSCPDNSVKDEIEKCVLQPASAEQRWTEFVKTVEKIKHKVGLILRSLLRMYK